MSNTIKFAISSTPLGIIMSSITQFDDKVYQAKNKNELPPDSNSYDNKMILRAIERYFNSKPLSSDFKGNIIY